VKVAVVGAGLFGATAAVELHRSGANVTLYERHDDLLMGATRANQGRIHRGYHYPRDPNAGDLSHHADRLAARFPSAVIHGNSHRYVIAEDSRVDPERYQQFCRSAGLRWMPATSPLVRSGMIIAASEAFLDVRRARAIIRRELHGVDVRCNWPTDIDRLSGTYDHVIDATYGRHWPEPLDYEVCETVLIELPPRYRRQSFVVMDGPFISLDPHGPAHMLYDVQHSVHAVNEVPEHLAPLLDRGLVRTSHTHLDAMLDTARRFLNHLGSPTYLGSLFTIRAVLPDDATDARPTLIRTDGNITRILAGKLCTAPWAAEHVASRLAAVSV
jgi:FAD dependent oxidoreductase